jgi:hypothetical protein
MTDPIVLMFLAILLSRKNKSSTINMTISSPSQLVERATQSRAMAWSPYFIDVGESPAVADALARWAGLESGGDAAAISRLNERGLLQVGPQTMSEGGISQADWDELGSKDTLPNEQARIAAYYWRWLLVRAITHLDSPPISPTDQVWFAYQYHQRPKDFTQWGKLPSDAASASAYLLGRAHTNNDNELAKRTTASNVVAWGTPDGPIAPIA